MPFVSDVIRDLGAGSVGGMCGVLASHPLDNAKTRMQASPDFQGYSATQVVKMTARSEGTLALYKGMAFPLMSAAAMNAILFCVQGVADRALVTVFGEDQHRLTNLLSGCIAGVAQSPFVNVAEIVKIQRQVSSQPPSAIGLVQERAQKMGLQRGLGQGLYATMPKESFSYGLYFLVYNEARQFIQERMHLHGSLATLTAGGLAGCASVGFTHPLDVVKSKIQSMPMDAPESDRRPLKVAREIIRQEGGGALTRGFTAALYRAFVANAAVFSGYEMAMHYYKSK